MNARTVNVRQVNRIPTAVISRAVANKADLSRIVPECCGLVWNALRAQGRRGGHNVALYRNAGAVVEAGVELVTPFIAAGEIVVSELPGCTAAWTVYYGPYSGLGEAHGEVQRWCKANGHAFGDVCWELYGHWQDAWNDDPAQIRTDVFYEIAGAPER
jgi:hypothetical protein